MMIKSYFVSAYVTSPSFYKWQPTKESHYFGQLANKKEISGIEHPFFLRSEKYPLSWLRNNIPDHWSIIITTLPAFMEVMKQDPNVGIASLNNCSRVAAVDLIRSLNSYSKKINETFRRKIIKAIHLNSCPKNEKGIIRGSENSLKRSLYEISEMEWDDIQLNLEHCDAYIYGRKPEKGLLTLENEIRIVKECNNYGIVLNWARSAIEFRSIQGPIKHIDAVVSSGLLKGFFFSGCSNTRNSQYGYWKDTHMPTKNLCEDSLMGDKEIKRVLNMLPVDTYLGIKVFNPDKNLKIRKSIALNLKTIDAINNVQFQIEHSKVNF